MRALSFLVLLAAIGLSAPAGAAAVLSGEGAPIVPIATDDDYARLVEQAVQVYIVPAYQDLGDATGKMVEAVRDYCAAPSASGRQNLDGTFVGLLSAWAEVDFMHFGPMGSAGRYERFAFWPDVHGTGARQLRQLVANADMAMTTPAAIAHQSAAVQGLPALELLLYADKDGLMSEAAPAPFRCALAGAIAANLDTIASDNLVGWTGEKGWSTLIENPSADNDVYRTHAEAATEVLKSILVALEQMRDQRIVPEVGDTPADARVSRAPYFLSGHTMDYLQAGSASLQRFIASTGMLELLPEDQDGYAASALFEFSNLDTALDAAGPNIAAALADEKLRSKLVYAAIVLSSLRDLFERHIAVAIGLTPGFNSLDGD